MNIEMQALPALSLKLLSTGKAADGR